MKIQFTSLVAAVMLAAAVSSTLTGCDNSSIQGRLDSLGLPATNSFPATIDQRWVIPGGFEFEDKVADVEIDVSGFGLGADTDEGVSNSPNHSIIRYDGLVHIGKNWDDEGTGRNFAIDVQAIGYDVSGVLWVDMYFGHEDEDFYSLFLCTGREGRTYINCQVTDARGNPLPKSTTITLLAEDSAVLVIDK